MDRLVDLFVIGEHVEVQTIWSIHQQMIAAYREADRAKGRKPVAKLIESLNHGVPAALTEFTTSTGR